MLKQDEARIVMCMCVCMCNWKWGVKRTKRKHYQHFINSSSFSTYYMLTNRMRWMDRIL